MASGVAIALVGATGAVGQTTLKLLEERLFPVKTLRVFASERSVGKSVAFHGEALRMEQLTPNAFKGIELALFSAGAVQAKEFAPRAVQAGAIVVDKSSAFRLDPTVPLIVPEINSHALRGHKGIVACPNCTTIIICMALKPLHEAGRLKRVVATTFQAVSGAGVKGMEELRRQVLAWSREQTVNSEHFPYQIAFNLIPQIDQFGEDGYTREEEKLINETRKILELPNLSISPTAVRVPVFAAHSIAINAETEQSVGRAHAREIFGQFPGLQVWDDPPRNRYPMPILAEGQDACFVGRIRDDLSRPGTLNFWVVGDQLRKGAALNGIQIAEHIYC
jgi:aspartate-semialdehyde dehydrogenase